MPEIKHQFTGGKMNKDLDERLIPNGEYKDAMNIQVSTSEGSDVGTAQNILGNISSCNYTATNPNPVTIGSSTVGSISDEKNDTLYWLVAGPNPTLEDLYDTVINPSLQPPITPLSLPIYNKDLIMRKTPEGCQPVFADVYSLLLRNPQISTSISSINFPIGTRGITSIKPGMLVTGVGSNGDSNTVTISSLTDTSSSANPTIYFNDLLDLSTNSFEYLYFHKNRVLNFDKNKLITGINIIDDMLFWTDNNTEPKKINISRSIEGTDSSGNIHTQLINDSQNQGVLPTSIQTGVREEHITVIKKSPKTPLTLNLETDRAPLKNYTGIINIVSDPNIPTVYIYDPSFLNISNTPWSYPNDIYDFSTLNIGDTFYVRIETDINGNNGFDLSGISTPLWTVGTKVVLKEFVNSTTPPVVPIKDTYTIKGQIVAWNDPATGTSFNSPTQVVDASGNITQEAQFAIKITALDGVPEVAHESIGLLQYAIDVFSESEKLFEFKFPRFSYRYKYQDGEYSTFAPFTEVGFSPGAFDYHPKKGYNLGMTNRVTEIVVQGFKTQDIPLDVVEIDLLYKDDASPNIYIVDTISPKDEPNPPLINNAWDIDQYTISSDTIYAVVPSNQLLRPWDNVPRKALAQEITGNRIVYGNYLQNYDLTLNDANGSEYYPTFQHNILKSGTTLDPFNRDNIKSIKSLREYQLGVVFIDEYGRETPVISNPSGTFKIAKSQAADENRLEVGFPGSVAANVPPIFKYYKFFIKETSGQYYNLAMDRFYDAEDGNFWLAFPSSERNKIDIDTILILKKTVNSSALIVEPAKYKILAIENEAPDFIKTKTLSIGEAQNVFGTTLSNSPVKDATSFELFSAEFDTSSAKDMHEVKEPVFVEFQDISNLDVSNRYRVTSMSKDDDSSGGVSKFYIKLEEPLAGDVDFMLDDLMAPTKIKDTIKARFFKHVVENEPKFDGRFFVKIYADDIFNTYVRLPQKDLSNANKRVAASKRVYYMAKNHKQRHDGTTFGANAAVWGGLDPSDDTVNANNYIYGASPGSLHGNIINQLVNPVDPFAKQLTGPQHPEWITPDSGIGTFKTQGGAWKKYQEEARDGTTSFYSGSYMGNSPTSGQQSWELLTIGGNRPSSQNYQFREVLAKNRGGSQTSTGTTTTMGWFSLPGKIHSYPAYADANNATQSINKIYPNSLSTCTSSSAYGSFPCGDIEAAPMPPSIKDWYYYTAYFATYSERTIQPRLAIPPTVGMAEFYSGQTAGTNENYKPAQWNKPSNFVWGDPHMYYDVLNEKNSANGYEDVWFIDDGQFVGQNSENQDSWKKNYSQGSIDGVFYNQRQSTQHEYGCLEQDPDSGSIPALGFGLQFKPCESIGLFNDADPNANFGKIGISFGGINPETRLEELYHGHVDPTDSSTIKNTTDPNESPSTPFQQFWIEDANSETDNFWDLTGTERNKYISQVPFIERISSGYQFRWKEDPTGQVYTIEIPPEEYNRLRYDSIPLSSQGNSRLAASHLAENVTHLTLDPSRDFPLNIGNRIENFFKNYNVTFTPAMTWDPINGGALGAIVDGKYINKYISDNTTNPVTTADLDASATTSANKIKISKAQYEASYDSKYGNREPIVEGMILTSVNASAITPVLVEDIQNLGADYEITFTGYQGTNANVTVSSGQALIFEQPTMNGLSINSARNITNHNTSTDGIGAVGYTLEFLEVDERGDMLPINPAIWETEPKDSTDLDIYYEISGSNVINLDDSTIDTALPVGALVSVFNSVSNASAGGASDALSIDQMPIPSTVQPDEYNIVTLSENLCVNSAGCPGVLPVAINDIFHITRIDGTTFDIVVESIINPSGGSFANQFKIKPFLYDTWHKLNWFNCYSFGNGVESNRIRDNFNVPFIGNGVKASTTLEYKYKEEHRKNGLIFSGIYNSNSGVNDLNQFIQAEQITKDINPIYGSVQKLHSQSTAQGDLIALCEDRVLKILANKDAIFNADGNTQLTANNNVLGQAMPYAGEFGISTNPESFASEAYRAYFSDKVRGVIMRLSKDGLTPISMYGMKDWFRDNLKLSDKVVGSYDDKKDEYNVSLSYSYDGYPAKIIGESKSGYPPYTSSGVIVVSGEVAQSFSIGDEIFGYGIPVGAVVSSIELDANDVWQITLKDANGIGITDFDITELGDYYGYGNFTSPKVYWITGVTAKVTRDIPIATVTFREDVKGWVSFKSFFPENAISCANDYYTFLNGSLYKHHEETVDRNTFYNDFTPSSLNVILNNVPGTVKSFSTLNYEGSQTRVDVSLDDNGLIINDGEYYNLNAKKGWFVESVETDKEKGSLIEFIEKEGKWFNYLRGQDIVVNEDNFIVINEDGSSTFDQASFAVQGIGTALSAPCIYGCMDSTASNYDPSVTCDDGSCDYIEPEVVCGTETLISSYDCDGQGGCYDPGNGNGTYPTLAICESNCVEDSYDCVNGVCLDPGTGLGAYASLADCQSNCVVATWNCISGACIDPGDGTGQYTTLVACQSDCAVTPTWDCVGGVCEDPGDGSGEYTSLTTCQANCLGAAPVYGCMDCGYIWEQESNQTWTNTLCPGNTTGTFSDNAGAINYYPGANVDDGSCIYDNTVTCNDLLTYLEACEDFLCLISTQSGPPPTVPCSAAGFQTPMELAEYWANEITIAATGGATNNTPVGGYLNANGIPFPAITATELYDMLVGCCSGTEEPMER